MKRPIFAANWKCALDADQVDRFVEWMSSASASHGNGHTILFGSSCFLPLLTPHTQDHLWIGAQDVSTVEKGAFTGEVAAFQLKSLQIKMVLVGHSERRHVFGETDPVLSQKLEQLKSMDIPACFCVGETEKQREEKKTLEIVQQQLEIFIHSMQETTKTSLFWKDSLIAYEPVWAIGTGKNATSKDIEAVHAHIAKLLNDTKLHHLPILYGGSVKKENAAEILKTPAVAGVLIGGASNSPITFDEIRNAV